MSIELTQLADYYDYLQPRPIDSHKGLFGHVLVIGGVGRCIGAAKLAAIGAARVGAGLITVATQDAAAPFINTLYPELMSIGIITNDQLVEILAEINVIVIGPGLGQSDWALEKLLTILKTEQPLVIDADGLNLLSNHQDNINITNINNNKILTPHPGEAARLLNKTVSWVQANREEAVIALQEKFGGIIILKGHGTLIIDTNKKIKQCTHGNPGMASGGMGDLLSGIIGGLVAQGLALDIAATCGVCLHSAAGDLAASSGGTRGLLATDLLPFIRKLVNPILV